MNFIASSALASSLRILITLQPATRRASACDAAKTTLSLPNALGFKTVNEVWDEDESGYYIQESSAPKVNTLDDYVFIIRTQIDRNTEDQAFYIDINSEELRDVLRKVLKDIHG